MTYQLEGPKFKMLTTPNAGKDVEQQKLSLIAEDMAHPFWKTVCQFLRKLNTLLPCNPGIMLLDI